METLDLKETIKEKIDMLFNEIEQYEQQIETVGDAAKTAYQDKIEVLKMKVKKLDALYQEADKSHFKDFSSLYRSFEVASEHFKDGFKELADLKAK